MRERLTLGLGAGLLAAALLPGTASAQGPGVCAEPPGQIISGVVHGLGTPVAGPNAVGDWIRAPGTPNAPGQYVKFTCDPGTP